MSKEVKGKPEGYTLLQAIEEGEVPVPGQLTFPERQRWRKSVGLRPTTRVDGQGTSTKEEVALWEAIMESRYGRGETLEAVVAVRRLLTRLPLQLVRPHPRGVA
jgi:hypothetical protein